MKTVHRALALALALAAFGAAAAPLRDPFARPAIVPPAPATAGVDAPAEAAPPPLELRAIMYDPGHSMANVSGRILSVGDTYGPYKVARIDERSVTLLRDKVKSVLVVDKESSK